MIETFFGPFPVSLPRDGRGRVIRFAFRYGRRKEECVLNRFLKNFMWAEFCLGIVVILVGWMLGSRDSGTLFGGDLFSGGTLLPVIGACMISLSAQCAAHSTKLHGVAIGFGVASLLFLAICTLNGFTYMASVSDYGNRGSSLDVLLVLAAVLLLHCFLFLPLEDRTDLAFLRRGVTVLIVFCAVGFLSILLNYLLSYMIYDSSLAVLAAQDYLYSLEADHQELTGYVPALLQDFHYVEGVFATAMGMTSARALFRSFVGREPMEDLKKEELK